VKFDYAGDADDFPLERSDPLVSFHFRPNGNEPGERLIGVFSSETDTCGPERAYGDRDNQTAHFDAFTNVLNGFRIFDYGSSSARVAIKRNSRPRIANNARMIEPISDRTLIGLQ
jgi:hypothetical protein